jgi:hypothetical protein
MKSRKFWVGKMHERIKKLVDALESIVGGKFQLSDENRATLAGRLRTVARKLEGARQIKSDGARQYRTDDGESGRPTLRWQPFRAVDQPHRAGETPSEPAPQWQPFRKTEP